MKWIYGAHKIYSLQCPSERQGKNFWLFIPTSVYSRSSEAICPAKHTYHAHRLPNRQPAKSLPKPLGKEAAQKEGVRPAAVRGRGTGDGEGRCRRARARGVCAPPPPPPRHQRAARARVYVPRGAAYVSSQMATLWRY
ncbi:uncharacterized protein LOC118016937 [Mirounga leonina]|uniref:uncharacterized protein LOC118016937 n=1 Tax=Mirounga leonina TaxID=9715 RepID=UPI00156BE16C|nr:uncharacterized protein LOC118016937 [Mirounga leonina]